jgi:hypothetical protein
MPPIHTSAKRATWSKDAKVRIAGGVTVNENCQTDLKLRWPLFTQALENLGTYQEYWAFHRISSRSGNSRPAVRRRAASVQQNLDLARRQQLEAKFSWTAGPQHTF